MMFKLPKLFYCSILVGVCCLVLNACATYQAPLSIDGVQLKNIKMPAKGLVTGGQPGKDDLRLLAERGVENVVNLRSEGEFDGFDEANQVDQLSMTYSALPVKGAAGVTVENARKLDKILSGLKGDTLIHCASGNRAGALLAIRAAIIQGEDIEKAMALGKAAGMTRLENKTRATIEEYQSKQ